MCGVSALFAIDPRPPELGAGLVDLTAAMVDQTPWRGPDHRGVWEHTSEPVAFGHRRLAIVDTSTEGQQPMTSACGRWTIAYNGEVYNARQLREELDCRSVWKGSSDTEVLLEAISNWGLEAALRRVNGMFAFVAWDHRDRVLWAARDRFGEKPLYWYRWRGHVAVMSDPAALRALPGWRGRFSRNGLNAVVAYRLPLPGAQAIEGLYEVRPGSCIAFRSGEVRPRCEAWTPPCSVSERDHSAALGPEGDRVERLEFVLEQAVRRQLIADVPVGVLLSGGIDSSLVTALARGGSATRVMTFSIGFDGDTVCDETPWAERIAAHLGTDHQSFRVTGEEVLELARTVPKAFSLPYANGSALPMLALMQGVSPKVRVVLTGDGGDELFFGYPKYERARAHAQSCSQAAAAPHALLRALHRLGRAGGESHAFRGLARRFGIPDPAVPRTTSVVDAYLHELFRTHPAVSPPLCLESEIPAELRRRSDEVAMVDLDLYFFLTGNVLTKGDRAAMYASVENRAPLLDGGVFEFVRENFDRIQDTSRGAKAGLRDVLARHVPRHLFERPKQGLDAPLEGWLRGPLRNWVETYTHPDLLRQLTCVNVHRFGHAWRAILDDRAQPDDAPMVYSVAQVCQWKESVSRWLE